LRQLSSLSLLFFSLFFLFLPLFIFINSPKRRQIYAFTHTYDGFLD